MLMWPISILARQFSPQLSAETFRVRFSSLIEGTLISQSVGNYWSSFRRVTSYIISFTRFHYIISSHLHISISTKNRKMQTDQNKNFWHKSKDIEYEYLANRTAAYSDPALYFQKLSEAPPQCCQRRRGVRSTGTEKIAKSQDMNPDTASEFDVSR